MHFNGLICFVGSTLFTRNAIPRYRMLRYIYAIEFCTLSVTCPTEISNSLGFKNKIFNLKKGTTSNDGERLIKNIS